MKKNTYKIYYKNQINHDDEFPEIINGVSFIQIENNMICFYTVGENEDFPTYIFKMINMDIIACISRIG